MPKTVFIVNPHAGNGSAGSSWPSIETLAKDRLGFFEAYMTKGPGDAVIFAKNAVAEKTKRLVCVGGDGTLNEIVNGIMMNEESLISDLMLGFIPNGTGCDFIRTVSIPQDLEQTMDLIASSHTRSIDLGVLLLKNHKGRDHRRYFHNIASFGLGGEVAQRVNQMTKALGPFISFMWATLISVFLYGTKRIRIFIDGKSEKIISSWNVVVANGQYHGGGMWVAPNASVCDGLFHVTIIGDLTIPEVFLNLSKLYNGRIYDIEKVITRTCQKMAAISDERVLLEVDGEQPGMLPVVAKILPGALDVIAN
ncbi:MAG TPA: diacylglycerol kinase family protein [Desulfobacterales bacterium]|nr:diacylglycerol kinase family protein [Desulfobacterales bacterium]